MLFFNGTCVISLIAYMTHISLGTLCLGHGFVWLSISVHVLTINLSLTEVNNITAQQSIQMLFCNSMQATFPNWPNGTC